MQTIQFRTIPLDLMLFKDQLGKAELGKDELGIVGTESKDIIQIKTPICLIKWDLVNQKEVDSLHNYRGVFDDETSYIPTAFKIPFSYLGKLTDQYIESTPRNYMVRFGYEHLLGKIYKLCDENDLYELLEL